MDALLEIEVVESEGRFDELQSDWQVLQALDTQATPFNTYAWLRLWWKHYKLPSYVLHLVLFKSNGETVGIAPLYVREHVQLKWIRQKELRWLGSGGDTSPDYLNIVCIPKHRSAIEVQFAAYIAHLATVQRVHLSDIAKPSALYTELKNSFASSEGTELSSINNTILTAELPAKWDDYRMALSRKRRKQINHRRNRLDQAGSWNLEICETEESRNSAVANLENLHRRRWKSKGAPGGFASDAYINFHRDVISHFYAQNQLWLATLSLDGNTIGVLYLFHWRDSLLFFQSGYSPDHQSLSPGHVLFTYVIQQAINLGVKRIDLLKGDYAYKKVYANNIRHTSSFTFVRPSIGSAVSKSKRIIKSMYSLS